MRIKGIRGAIDVAENTAEAIRTATRKLLREMISRNDLRPEQIAAIFFTATPDLNAEFPARTAREMGLTEVPLLCAQEMAVPHALPRMLRVLILANTDDPTPKWQHCYLGRAVHLRSDLAEGAEHDSGDAQAGL